MSQHSEDSPPKKLFPSIEKYDFDIPEWLDMDHPDFPRYFAVAVFNEKGEVIRWWQCLPEHMRLPPPL